jgi:hypothetical protein
VYEYLCLYRVSKKRCKYWNPIKKIVCVSVDVTFQEFEPYYTRKGDLDQLLEFSTGNESGCELNSGTNDGGIQGEVIVGTIQVPIPTTTHMDEEV